MRKYCQQVGQFEIFKYSGTDRANNNNNSKSTETQKPLVSVLSKARRDARRYDVATADDDDDDDGDSDILV